MSVGRVRWIQRRWLDWHGRRRDWNRHWSLLLWLRSGDRRRGGCRRLLLDLPILPCLYADLDRWLEVTANTHAGQNDVHRDGVLGGNVLGCGSQGGVDDRHVPTVLLEVDVVHLVVCGSWDV